MASEVGGIRKKTDKRKMRLEFSRASHCSHEDKAFILDTRPTGLARADSWSGGSRCLRDTASTVGSHRHRLRRLIQLVSLFFSRLAQSSCMDKGRFVVFCVKQA